MLLEEACQLKSAYHSLIISYSIVFRYVQVSYAGTWIELARERCRLLDRLDFPEMCMQISSREAIDSHCLCKHVAPPTQSPQYSSITIPPINSLSLLHEFRSMPGFQDRLLVSTLAYRCRPRRSSALLRSPDDSV